MTNKQVICPLCGGSGRVSIEDYLLFGWETKCMACKGSGQLEILLDPDLDNLEDVE
jgi:DnaJ-class molecular chaperone